MAEASALAILNHQHPSATSPDINISSHLYALFRFLRSEESTLKLPLVIPRAILSLCHEEVHTHDFRGQLFASLGSFLRLEMCYARKKENEVLWRYFLEAELALTNAAASGRQEMVMPIVAAMLYASEIPVDVLVSQPGRKWMWKVENDNFDEFGPVPRLVKAVLLQWCGVQEESMNHTSKGWNMIGSNDKQSSLLQKEELMWTLLDFHSLLFAVEKVVSNLFAHYDLPSQETRLSDHFAAALDVPMKKSARNDMIMATVASAILSSIFRSGQKAPIENAAKTMISVVSKAAKVSLPYNLSQVPMLAYLLSLTQIRSMADRLQISKNQSEALSCAILQLVTPVKLENSGHPLDESSWGVIKNYQESLSETCAILAARASASSKFATLLHNDIKRVERSILNRTESAEGKQANEGESSREGSSFVLRKFIPQTPAVVATQIALRLSENRHSSEHTTTRKKDGQTGRLTQGSPYFEERIVKNIHLFLQRSIALQKQDEKYGFSVVSLRILSHLPMLANLITVHEALLNDLTAIAFGQGPQSPLKEFVQSFPEGQNEDEVSAMQLNFGLDVLRRAASIDTIENVERIVPMVLPRLSGMIIQVSASGDRARTAAKAILSLPTKEKRSKQYIVKFWRSLLGSPVPGWILNDVLESILKGAGQSPWILKCFCDLGRTLLDEQKLMLLADEESSPSKNLRTRASKWGGRGLEQLLGRSLIRCDIAILPGVAAEVEKVALKGDKDLARTLTKLVIEAAEVSDLLRRRWLVEWSLKLAKRLGIKLQTQSSRARL